MFNLEISKAIGLIEEEIETLRKHDTSEKFQEFIIRAFPYDFEEDGVEHFPSFRRILRERKAHCFAGAILGATYLYLNDLRPPLVIRIDGADMPHHLAVYWKDGKIGSIGASRHVELTGKIPQYRSYRDLVMSYYPNYYNDITNDRNDLTMRGFCGPVDLRIFDYNWIIAEDDLTEIVEYLDRLPNVKLFPERPSLYAQLQSHGDLYFFRKATSSQMQRKIPLKGN